MFKLREKFTRWYYRKGYRMMYHTSDYADGVAACIFSCPWWVKPLVGMFFSPSVYYALEGHDFGEVVSARLEELKGDGDVESTVENSQETA